MKWRITQTDTNEFRIELLLPDGQWFLGEDIYASRVATRLDARQRYGLSIVDEELEQLKPEA